MHVALNGGIEAARKKDPPGRKENAGLHTIPPGYALCSERRFVSNMEADIHYLKFYFYRSVENSLSHENLSFQQLRKVFENDI